MPHSDASSDVPFGAAPKPRGAEGAGPEERVTGSAPAKAKTAVARACRDALAVWESRFGDAIPGDLIDRSLDLLASSALESPGTPLPLAFTEEADLAAVRKGLVDLVRSELLDPSNPERPDPPALVPLLDRLEEIRRALEPGWSDQVEAGLMGPGAGELLAEVGHDLRSPLTSILFLSEVLRGAAGIRDDEHQVGQLGLIYSAAFTMLQIVNNFVELARGEAESSEALPTPFSLEELVEGVRRSIQPLADDKGLVLEVDTTRLRHDRRFGSPVPLSRILLNLMTNGVKFTDEGGVRVRVYEEGKSGDPVHGRVHFEITDTGPGLLPDSNEAPYQVFEPAQDRAGIRLSGSGLGLVIVRRLLESMGSTLSWSSEPGRGSTFRFVLALELADPHGAVAERRGAGNGDPT